MDMRRLLTIFTGFLSLLLLLSMPVYAAGREEADVEHSWWYASDAYVSPASEEDEEPYHPDATLLGIDVSHHQGEIDWDAVAQSQVDFVIIRCGYGMDQEDQDDREFLNNVAACERLGIPYGVYLYSYATNTQRAQSEAEHVLRLINGHTLSYPVFYDLEDSSAMECDLAAIATVFCEQIQAAGYKVGVYSSKNWWENYLTDLCFDQWYRWVAHYNPTCGYTGDYQLWQFTSTGSVEGISGNVDMNYQIGYPEDHGTTTYFHTYTAAVTEPTCTEMGYTLFTCGDCGNSYTACKKETLEHAWDAGTVAQESTCVSYGHKIQTCVDCGATREVMLPLAWHDFQDRVCTVCGIESPVRIAGENRYETGFAVADQLKAYLGAQKFGAIIVASGRKFPDALTGSYLANQVGAPILLANGKNANSFEQVKQYIGDNLESGGTVYILGGESAVPAQLETMLEGYAVRRLVGENRYETNLAILSEAGTADQEILICTGKDFADSLSASGVNKPILLLNGKTISDAQRAFLENSSGKFIIIGGESAISGEMEAELGKIGTVVKRIAGANRYETSVLVAEYFFKQPITAVVTSAKNFPDGLCGGPLANAMQVPLIVTAARAEATANAYLNANGIRDGVVLGGIHALPDDTVNRVFP